jgi:arylsulfatase A-like enzyme
MLVKWPGTVQPGSLCDDYLIIEDYFPTILEMAGIRNYQVVQQVDGISFMPMLKQEGSTATDRDLIWHYPNKWGPSGPGIGSTSTIRSGDWKLIYYYKDQQFELYNIPDDIGEQRNLAGSYPDKVTELAGRLSFYLMDVNAHRPTLRASGELAPWPGE